LAASPRLRTCGRLELLYDVVTGAPQAMGTVRRALIRCAGSARRSDSLSCYRQRGR
jgi:hypothetical protein